METNTIQKRLKAALNLLSNPELFSHSNFESIRTLVKGIDPKIDRALDSLTHSLSHLEKIHEGDVINLAAEALPEETEEQKKRKKALLFFIKNLNELKSEIARVEKELETAQQNNSSRQQAMSSGKIIHFAKGPFGIVTLVAVVIVGIVIFTNSIKTKQNETIKPTTVVAPQVAVKGIIVNGKKIPLSEIYVGTGNDCDSSHYHALNHVAVKALDGSTVSDPGGCGFGRVRDVSVVDIQ